MRVIKDYSRDFKNSYKIMKGKTHLEQLEKNTACLFIDRTLQVLVDTMPNVSDIGQNRFAKLLFHMDNVARINGGKIEVNFDEEKKFVQIYCACDGYYIISKEKDLTRECFFHLCDIADSFFVINRDKRVEIDANLKME